MYVYIYIYTYVYSSFCDNVQTRWLASESQVLGSMDTRKTVDTSKRQSGNQPKLANYSVPEFC